MDEHSRRAPRANGGAPPWRPPLALNAHIVYMIMSAGTSFLMACIFTVNMVYHAVVVGLGPLQLVLVGTILEATVFLFEIPTGVVADLKSRRLSIIVGSLLMGAGFIVEGSVPRFWAVALCQVMWGLGYTFTSGATQAWIVDEIGRERAGEAFLRGAQAGHVGGLLAIPVSVALGTVAVGLPIVLGGGALLLLAAFFALAMPEEGFCPAPAAERTTWASMRGTLRDAGAVARRQPLLLTLLGIGLFYGLYSEGVDRLWTIHLLEDLPVPALAAALGPVVWFGAIGAVKSVIGLAVTEVARRRVDTARPDALGRVLTGSAAAIVVALAGFGLAGQYWVALGLLLVVSAMRTVTGPLFDVWYNQRIDDSSVRATLFSVSGQVDAIGQVAGGPVVGAVGEFISVPMALVTSALMLSPVLPLYAAALRRGEARVAVAP